MKRKNSIEFRPMTKEELPAYKKLIQYVFAGENPPTEKEAEENPEPLQPQWSL